MSADQGVTEVPVSSQVEDFSADAGGYDDEGGQPGMGQSKSSRRRRRKRKGKAEGGEAGQSAPGGDAVGAIQGDQGQGEPASSAAQEAGNSSSAGSPTASAGQPQQPGPFRQAGNGQRPFNNGPAQNAPGGTKRWKKKNFRDRPRTGDNNGSFQAGAASGQSNGGYVQQGFQAGAGQGHQGQGFQNNGFRGPDTHQPGNNAFKRKGGGGGGFGKQRNGGGGARGGFVGPMDHSYRPINGNVFDASPTMENSGGGGGRGRSFHSAETQPIDYSQGRVIPIKEGTPTHIYFFIEDLFFTAKISETARKLGVKIAFIKNEKEQIAALTSGQDTDRPGLIVFDLNNANAKPLTLIPKLKTKLKKTTSIIGFLSHLQGDLKAKAVEAGCDSVMPRAAFSQNLPNLLRRYGIEEAEEPNFNQ